LDLGIVEAIDRAVHYDGPVSVPAFLVPGLVARDGASRRLDE
jgi:hypothetical protein